MDSVRGAVTRVARAWAALTGEQRLAAAAALILLATLFLPWYEKSVFVPEDKAIVEDKLSGFGSADFVMASVVLVGLGVLGLLFARGERRGFHLPGGDGIVVVVAGAWAALLIFYRVLDHPDVSGQGATLGIQWGVFVAFLAAALLVYAGLRIRHAQTPEPPLPMADPPPRAPSRPRPPRPPREEPPTEVAPGPRRRRPVAAPRPADDDRPAPGQMSFDEAETHER